jgi:hypothetical protein
VRVAYQVHFVSGSARAPKTGRLTAKLSLPLHCFVVGSLLRGGWPAFNDFACAIPTEGAPSLRFLQGWAAVLVIPH